MNGDDKGELTISLEQQPNDELLQDIANILSVDRKLIHYDILIIL